ncbi:hypothetical protein HPB47_009037, partial [Ixodes persulcatus]
MFQGVFTNSNVASQKPEIIPWRWSRKTNLISASDILYADIVNFTRLSEQLSASDLVQALNELFGRFDQIAQ